LNLAHALLQAQGQYLSGAKQSGITIITLSDGLGKIEGSTIRRFKQR
jgi:hypothetical protein